jgi:alpha-beta hydrolase superfamily lysophospholipase
VTRRVNSIARSGNTAEVQTLEYSKGRLVDLFGDPAHPPVLIWHGMQTDSRAAIRPLAQALADHGAHVIVPDWNSHSDDGGRADLLSSIQFASARTAEQRLVLVGWSMGGVAAASLTVHSKSFGVDLAYTVCLAGAFMATDPISGTAVGDAVSAEAPRTPFLLLHGVHDDVVDIASSRSFASRLSTVGWPVELVEVDADHGSISGARYDRANDRYVPADDVETLAVASKVAARIAQVLSP